jgi:hypothetical protein
LLASLLFLVSLAGVPDDSEVYTVPVAFVPPVAGIPSVSDVVTFAGLSTIACVPAAVGAPLLSFHLLVASLQILTPHL